MDDVLYTLKELATLLKTNVNYVCNLRKTGLLPFLRLSSFKVRKPAVDKFLAKYEGKGLNDPFTYQSLMMLDKKTQCKKVGMFIDKAVVIVIN